MQQARRPSPKTNARVTSASTSAPPARPGGAASNPSSLQAADSKPLATLERKPTGRAEITGPQIAEAAYFLWLKRGGNDLVNWLEAEATLKSRRG